MSDRLRFLRMGSGIAGATLLGVAIAIALAGPAFAPHSPDAPVGAPLSHPSSNALLGTDFLGRDVLSRVLWGGRSVLELAGLATLLAYAVGVLVGLVAGYSRNLVDPALMRTVDVVLSLPPLLVLLVLVSGVGAGVDVLVVGVAAVQIPLIARLVRAATLEQSVRGYVEAAAARGEGAPAILRREILPNIMPVILADAGLRFAYSIILVASVNFLGLGLQPPASDWALIISENRVGLTLNPYVILAPALLIGILTIGVSLLGDAVSRTLGRSMARGAA